MKTFEERLAAWLNGQLSGQELAAFERELEAHPEALAETEADRTLGNLLRTHLPAARLANADFFNHQLLQQIEADEAALAPARPTPQPLLWGLRRMVYAGAFLLLLATGLFFATVPKTRRQVASNEKNLQIALNPSATAITASEVVHVSSDDPNVTATCFHSKDNEVNVVWLDGLSYLPRDHKLK